MGQWVSLKGNLTIYWTEQKWKYTYQNLWDATKAVLTGKCSTKGKSSSINQLCSDLNKLEKEEQNKYKASRRNYKKKIQGHKSMKLNYLYTQEKLKHMFIKDLQQKVTAIFFIIAINWNQPVCLSMDTCINKMWYNHTMKYYSAVKPKKSWYMLQYGWISTMLCQVKEANIKTTYCMTILIWNFYKTKYCTDWKLISGCLGLGVETDYRHKGNLWGEENVLALDSGDGCTTNWIYPNLSTCILKLVKFVLCKLYLNLFKKKYINQ